MPIVYHETTATFHLYNEHISYIIKVLDNGHIGQLYFGERIHDKDDFNYLLELGRRPNSAYETLGESMFSLEHIKQEYPTYGSGDMRLPAINIMQENGSHIVNFCYKSHSIYQSKKKLDGLPATYANNDNEITSLTITLYDAILDAQLELHYSIFENEAVIARNASIVNKGTSSFVIDRMMSLNLDLPDKDYTLMEFTGAWARERHLKERKLEHGIHAIHSLRGHSSHHFNPFFILRRNNANESMGEAIGFHFVYSGNFLNQMEVDTYDVTRVTIGIHPEYFSWELHSQETFQTPEVLISFTSKGLNHLSKSFHNILQHNLTRSNYKEKVRPILINNWEATYFNFTEDKLQQIAETAKDLGIELFVLDDGWYGKRNNDLAGLGDWQVNHNKLPNGIKGLSDNIHKMGMQFGIWIEPEMVNKDSNLFRNHPEWVLHTPNRIMHHSRNQYVLDMSNPNVVDYLFLSLKQSFHECHIDYIKWDMNRSMSDVYSHFHSPQEQGRVMHKYILGLYELYERLIMEFPNILFESCASGGGRFDAGMLYYAPQCWTSDDTDAIERLKIQYGTSYGYPIASMGSHVSASPNHQVLRKTPLETRANVAYFGTFGYELDLSTLSPAEKEVIKTQITFMKEHRNTIQCGDFYRIMSPFDHNGCAWMSVSKNKDEAIVGYYRPLQEVNVHFRRIKLSGLDATAMYTIDGQNIFYYGDELMNVGLLISDISSLEIQSSYDEMKSDSYSTIFVLKKYEA